MKKLLATAAALGALTLTAAQTEKTAPGKIQRAAKTDRSGTAWTVRAADGPMMFTGQVFATDVSRDARAQAGQALCDIRGVYFDPTRAPAASALNVTSLGRAKRSLMLDMIAVPAR